MKPFKIITVIFLLLPSLLQTALAHDIDLDGLYDPQKLDSIDWDKAQHITLDFEDNIYSPDELTLKKDQPYVLILKNTGNRSHDFVDLDFFHNISISKIAGDFGRIYSHHIHSLYLRKGHTVELFFIPHKEGEFEFFCSIKGHRADGMEGFITIAN